MKLLRHNQIEDTSRVFERIDPGTCHPVGEGVLHLTDVADVLRLGLEHEPGV